MAELPEYPIPPEEDISSGQGNVPDYLWPYDPLGPPGATIFEQYPGVFDPNAGPAPPRPPSTSIRTARPSRRSLRITQPRIAEVQASNSAEGKPIRIAYGSVLLGGEIIWVGDYAGRWIIHVRWCLGEIDAPGDIFLNDQSLPLGSSVTNYTGTATQGVDPTLASAIPGFNDPLIVNINGTDYGIAHSIVQIEYDRMPDTLNFTARLSGMKILDPRDGATEPASNPSLHAYDMLRNPNYGLGWNVDEESVKTAADENGAMVQVSLRRAAGMVVQASGGASQWIETLSAAAAIFIVTEGDTVKFRPNRPWTESVPNISCATDIKKGSFRYSPTNQRDIPNKVQVYYTDTSVIPWAERVATYEDAQVGLGNERARIATFQMPWILNHAQAYREAKEIFHSGRSSRFNCSWIGKDDQIKIERGDVIRLVDIPGISFDRNVRVLRNDLTFSDGMYLPKITAIEYTGLEFQDDDNPGIPQTAPSFISPLNPPAPLVFSATEVLWLDKSGNPHSSIRITWDGIEYPHIQSYRVVVLEGAQIVYEQVILHSGTGEHTAQTGAVEEDINYTVQVFSVSSVGSPSATPASASITPNGDVLPPDDVTNLDIIEYAYFIKLSWDNILTLGDEGYRIKRGTVAQTWETASELDETMRLNPVEFSEDRITFVDDDCPQGLKRYFVKGIDKQGDESIAEASVDIDVKEPKGSFREQVPQVPTVEMNRFIRESLVYSIGAYDLLVSTPRCGMWLFSSQQSDGWTTAADIQGAGVLQFAAVGIRASLTLTNYRWGIRITIDNKRVIDIEDRISGVADTKSVISAVGEINTRSFDNQPSGIDLYHLPFQNSLKVEFYGEQDLIANVFCRYMYYLTELEFPASRPAKSLTLQTNGQIIDARANLFTFLDDNLFDCQIEKFSLPVAGLQTAINLSGGPGMIHMLGIAGKNEQGVARDVDLRVTIDGNQTDYVLSVPALDEAGICLAGNFLLDDADNVSIFTFDEKSYDQSLLVEVSNRAQTNVEVIVFWVLMET